MVPNFIIDTKITNNYDYFKQYYHFFNSTHTTHTTNPTNPTFTIFEKKQKMINLNSVVKPSKDIVPRKTDDEYVLVPVSNNIADMDRVFTLNETGAFIWEKLDGNLTLKDICLLIQNEFDVDLETAENDVLSFVKEMEKFLIITG